MEYNRHPSQCQDKPSRRRLITAAAAFGLTGCAALAQTDSLTRMANRLPGWIPQDDLQPLLERVAGRTGEDPGRLYALFAEAELQTRALDLTRPVAREPGAPDKRSWRKTLAQQTRPALVQAGRRFLSEESRALRQTEEQYGVPSEVITAVLGVETRYGTYQGNFPTLNTLATLGFQGHRRRDYFLQELEALLMLAVELDRPAAEFTGSFAGALGMPQFMPSNYRRLAVDFDGDGRIDLFNSPADAIGSIANFLVVHGWAAGEALRWSVSESAQDRAARQNFVVNRLEAEHRFNDLMEAGLLRDARGDNAAEVAESNIPASLIELPERTLAPVVWAVGRNFFALTQYNRSYLYAAGVIALSEALQAG